MSDVETLVALAKADTDRMRLDRQVAELPQAAEIMACRAKRKELKGRQDQVVELTDDADAKMSALEAEEAQVREKIDSLQETLDTSSDYRVTQSVTKELDGQKRRLTAIGKDQEELLARHAKIDELASQVQGMLDDLDRRETALTEDFKREGGELKRRLDELAGVRADLLAQLPADLASTYEKTRESKGGIALSFFEGDHCSVCRTTLPASQLASLAKGPALAECPNCHRMMIAHEED